MELLAEGIAEVDPNLPWTISMHLRIVGLVALGSILGMASYTRARR